MLFGSRKKTGVIGLGVIGTRVAASLRKNGYKTFVWNRTPRTVPNFLGSAAEIANHCRTIQIFLSDEEAVRSCLEVLLPRLSSQHTILCHATVTPGFTREIASKVENTGAAFLEAPFTGSLDAAEKGALVYYIGGETTLLEKVRPLLEASSKAILPIGAVGDASTVKLATNMITAVTVQTLTESLALVKSTGIAPEKFLEAVQLNACRSGVADMKLQNIIQGNYKPHFALKHMLKDMRYALQVAGQTGLELPATSVAAATLLAGTYQGISEKDFSAIAIGYGFPEAQTPKTDTKISIKTTASSESPKDVEVPENKTQTKLVPNASRRFERTAPQAVASEDDEPESTEASALLDEPLPMLDASDFAHTTAEPIEDKTIEQPHSSIDRNTEQSYAASEITESEPENTISPVSPVKNSEAKPSVGFPQVIPRRRAPLPKPPLPKNSASDAPSETFIDSSRSRLPVSDLANESEE